MVKQAYKMLRKCKSPAPPSISRREIISIREALDDLAVARCPLCRMMLIARMGRRGPGFYCRCSKKRAA